MKQRQMTTEPCNRRRRSFLKLSGLLGLGAAAAAVLPAAQAEAVLFGRRQYKVSRSRLAMGTLVTMTAIHPSRDQAEESLGLAFAEIDRLSGLLSRHDPASPVSLLNAEGFLAQAPPELVEVVGRALAYHRQSNGAFEITVKPLIDLYQASFQAGQAPSEAAIDALLPRIGSEQIRLSGRRISFAREQMGITLDGIAKGYIVDQASELLRRQGIANHLINAGGDIRTSGSAAGGKAWTVAIQDPAKGKEYPAVMRMTDGAVATSGNYEIFYDQEKLFHHIVDSRTGHSPRGVSSVTVKAASVLAADALSTSLFVLPATAGLALIEQQPGQAALLIGSNGTVTRSATWSS